MSEHEHDEDCEQEEEGFYGQTRPCWRFSTWDVVGIAMSGVGGILVTVGQTFGYLAQEFMAAANYSRQTHDLIEAQRLQELGEQKLEAAMIDVLKLPEAER